MKCLSLTFLVWGILVANLVAQTTNNQSVYNTLNSNQLLSNNSLGNTATSFFAPSATCSVTIDSVVNIGCNGDSTGAIYTTTVVDTTSCTSSVVALNEFLYNPNALHRDGLNPYAGEFIELIGPAGTDISCYVLTDGDWTITMPAGSIIPPDGFFTIGNDSIWGTGTFDLDAENCNCFTDGVTDGLLILTTGGEYVALYDNAGTFLEGVIYGTPTTANSPPTTPTAIATVGAAGCPASVIIPTAASFEMAPGGVADEVSLIRDPDGSGAWGTQAGGSLGACNNSSAGVSTVTYLWNNGDTTENISGLPAGTYTVTLTSTSGCTDTATYTITEPAALTATTMATDIACVGDTTGAIDLTITGGTTPYSFNWSNGDTTEDLSMLLSANYCVTITDSSGCMAIACDSIEEPFFTIPVDTFYLCAGDSVQIQVNTNITNLSWTPSASLTNDTINNPFASPTTTTTYVVSTTGSTCTTIDSIVVIVDTVTVSLATVNPLCNGDTTGSIMTTAIASNYNYLWNTGDTTANLINIGAGTYTLTVSFGSCQDTLSAIITEPDTLAATLFSSINPSCNGDSTGAITITNTGGTAPYTYFWSNTATTQNLSNLPAGSYNLTLTDGNGCTAPLSVVLTEPFAISVSYNVTNVSCGGTNDGTASVVLSGGTPGYTYLWDVTANNQTTATATNLTSSTYSVTVTDTVGCTAEANGIFVSPGIPVDSNDVPLVIITGALDCDLNPVGALEINTANNYSYLWSNGATTRSVSGLPAGTYTVTVTNGLGCNYIQTATISSPFVPIVNPFIVNIGLTTTTVTSGTLVNINGGNDQSFQGVTYNWTSPSTDVDFAIATAHNTTAMSTTTGQYVLTLTATANDATACQDTGSVVLNVESVYNGMPSAFTPNEDGINDLYRPAGLNGDDVLTFRIYNRWGQEVYNGDALENMGWDGRFQGVEQPTEVYLFVLEYKLGANPEAKVHKGEFSLIR